MKTNLIFLVLILTFGTQFLNAETEQNKCASIQAKDTCLKYSVKKKLACRWKFDPMNLPYRGECLTVSDYNRVVKEEAERQQKEAEEKNFCSNIKIGEDCNKPMDKFSCGWLTHPRDAAKGKCIVRAELDRILRSEDPSDRRPKSQEAVQMSREDYFRTFK